MNNFKETLQTIISENNFSFSQFYRYMSVEYKHIPLSEIYGYYFGSENLTKTELLNTCLAEKVSLSRKHTLNGEEIIFEPITSLDGLTIKTNKKVDPFKVATTFVGKDDLRPVMCGVNVTEKYLYATDAHALVRLTRPSDLHPLKVDQIINPKNLQPIEWKYPNAESVIPTNNLLYTDLNTAKLLNCLDQAAKINKLLCVPLPIQLAFGGCVINFAVDKLTTCLKALEAYNIEVIKVSYTDSTRAVLFCGTDILTLCMPMLLNNYRTGEPMPFITVNL